MKPYFSEKFHREAVAESHNEVELIELLEILMSHALSEEIDKGNITLAMIRPHLGGSNLQNYSDREAAEKIEESIRNLGIVAKFSVTFDCESLQRFYLGKAERQMKRPPERHKSFSNRWEEFLHFMTLDKSTILILYCTDGEAVTHWKDQRGNYDIVGRRDSSTIRGQFGLDNYNNLVHGSDDPEEVRRELSVIIDLLLRDSSIPL